MQTPDSVKYQTRNPIKKFFIGRFQREILNLVKLTQAGQVLDIGCGEGYLLKFLNDQIKGWHLEGFDISEELVNRARQRVLGVNLSVRDIYNCGYQDASFDLVLSTEVLEHLEDPQRALNEIRRLTKKWVILSVPNEPLFAISNLFTGKNVFSFGNPHGHRNRWSAKRFMGLVNEYFKLSFVSKPFPWTIILGEKNDV
jgi:2-polyprenyl-3-methyl-5-hydroxy-6-metoxy-1,4-benzoquinol methylase